MAAEAFDRSVLKVSQALIISINLLAFCLGFVFQVAAAWVLVPLVAAVMLAGVARPDANLFRLLYLKVLKPRRLVKPRVIQDDPAPHRFAQAVGGAFLVAASLAFVAGAVAVGWILTWVVIVLAFINFAFDYCVGCQMYFQLDRLDLLPNRT